MESFIRKAIVCFSAVFALVFVSCADKESKYPTLLLNGSYSYLMCSADSDCADAESEAGHFQKLNDSSYRNLEKIAGSAFFFFHLGLAEWQGRVMLLENMN